MVIADNLHKLKSKIPNHVTLVAVSKTKRNDLIMNAYDAGHRVFGENKIQEMVTKHEALPKDIEWHMIGHLQRNKVKYMACNWREVSGCVWFPGVGSSLYNDNLRRAGAVDS